MMRLPFILIVMALAACTPSSEKSAAGSTTLTTASSATAAQNVVLIDVRTPEEFQSGNLPHSVNVPYEQISSRIGELAADKNTPINLYCKSGRRAGIALEELKKLGYTHVNNLGGYQDLVGKYPAK